MAMTTPSAAQGIIINTLGVVVLMHIMDFFKLQVIEVDPGEPFPKVNIFCQNLFVLYNASSALRISAIHEARSSIKHLS